MKKNKIFLSYSNSDKAMADRIDLDFSRVGIRLIRDIRDLKYQDSISIFIPTKKEADYSICIISDPFIKSINCMWEMMDLWKKDLFEKQICPIIVDSLCLNNDAIVDYSIYWQEKHEHLKQRISSMSLYNQMGFKNELDKHHWISTYITEFLHYLKDKKYITYSQIEQEGLHAYSNSIFTYIGIQPTDNIEMLYQLSTQNDVNTFEIQAEKYIKEVTSTPSELFLFTRAGFYEKMKYDSLAVYYYQKSLEINDKFIPALEALAKLYISGTCREQIDIDKILELLNDIEGEKSFVSLSKGMLSFTSSVEKSLAYFENAKTLNPTNEYIYNNIGCCMEAMGHLENAINNYQTAIEIKPDYYQAYNNLAIAYIKTRKIDAGKAAIQKCLEIKPDYAYGHSTKGLLLEEEGNYADAIACYLNALTYKVWTGPFSNIGRIYEYEFETPMLSKQYYTQAYALNKESVVTNFNLGNYYRKYTTNTELALQHLEKAYHLDAKNTLCTLALGILYRSLGKQQIANNYFALSYINNPTSSLECFWICCSLLEDKEYEKVKSFLDKFRKQKQDLLLDFFFIYFYMNICKQKQPFDSIINLWKENAIYQKHLQNIDYDDALLYQLQKISEKYLSMSKDHIYKEQKIVPLSNLDAAYEYIKEHFYELL